MTFTAGIGTAQVKRTTDPPLALAASFWAGAVCGAFAIAAALVDLENLTTRSSLTFLILGGVCLLTGLWGTRRFRGPFRNQRAKTAFAAAVSAWTTMFAISSAAYLLAGAATSVPNAIFESVAGFCTTSLSAFADVESLSRGVLFWRAATQWIGGYASLMLLVVVLPTYTPMNFLDSVRKGIRVSAGADPRLQEGLRLRQILTAYTALTLICAALYGAAGMGVFDAATYAFSTASTGGMANHAQGMAHFNSPAVEWAATAGMAISGVSIVAVWWALRGRFGTLWHSFELKVYVGLLLLLSLLTWVGSDPGLGTESLRSAAFSVSSAISSTGFRLADWSEWSGGLQLLILGLILTGGMSGSAGGGFRLSRAVPALQYAYRELVIQLHPNAVHVVKLGRKYVSEGSLSFLNAFQILLGMVVVGGAFCLALTGMDLLGAVSGAMSALATMGPALGDLAPSVDAYQLSGGERGFLMALMFLGRLMLYPVLITLGVLAGGLWTQTRGVMRSRFPKRTLWLGIPRRRL